MGNIETVITKQKVKGGPALDRSQIIAAELRAHRARVDETQKEVAENIGVEQSTLSSWENRGGIGLDDAWKLADHYGVTLDVLAGRS